MKGFGGDGGSVWGLLRGYGRGFGCAFAGLALVVRSQRNAWIHLCATASTVGLAGVLGLPPRDWAVLVLAMGAVWSAEAMNTALERLADAAVPGRHPLVGQAKDMAAAGVLLAAMGSVAIGLLILGPPLWSVIGGWLAAD